MTKKNPEEYVAVIPYKDIFKLFSLLNKTVQHRKKRRRRPPRPHPIRRMSTTPTTTTTMRPTTKESKPRLHRMPKPRTTRAATTTTHRPKKVVKVRIGRLAGTFMYFRTNCNLWSFLPLRRFVRAVTRECSPSLPSCFSGGTS